MLQITLFVTSFKVFLNTFISQRHTFVLLGCAFFHFLW